MIFSESLHCNVNVRHCFNENTTFFHRETESKQLTINIIDIMHMCIQ